VWIPFNKRRIGFAPKHGWMARRRRPREAGARLTTSGDSVQRSMGPMGISVLLFRQLSTGPRHTIDVKHRVWKLTIRDVHRMRGYVAFHLIQRMATPIEWPAIADDVFNGRI